MPKASHIYSKHSKVNTRLPRSRTASCGAKISPTTCTPMPKASHVYSKHSKVNIRLRRSRTTSTVARKVRTTCTPMPKVSHIYSNQSKIKNPTPKESHHVKRSQKSSHNLHPDAEVCNQYLVILTAGRIIILTTKLSHDKPEPTNTRFIISNQTTLHVNLLTNLCSYHLRCQRP